MSDGPIPSSVESFVSQWTQEGMEGMRIKGFGPDDPPAPTYPPLEDDDLEDNPEIPKVELPKSPLVELGRKAQQPKKGERETLVPSDGLLVMGSMGAYKGQQVELLDSEQAAIARIVLEAAQRHLRGHLDEVKRQAPKRARKPKAANPTAPEAPKKRRGRPPKVKVDG